MTAAILLVGLPADASAVARQGLALAGEHEVAELSLEAAVEELTRVPAGIDAVVVWDPGAGGGVAFAQRVARIDRGLAVVIVSPPERIEAIRRAVRYAPFLGEEVMPRSLMEVELLGAEVAEAAERTRRRRAHKTVLARATEQMATEAGRPLAGYVEHLLRHAPVGVATVDVEGEIRGFSSEAARMLGVEREAALGQTLDALVPSVHRRALRRLIASAAGEPGARLVLELESAGSACFVEVSASRYIEGDEPTTIVILNDVTDRERAAMRLRHLQAVTDAALTRLDLDEMLDELLTRIRPALSVDTAAVLLLDPDGTTLRIRASLGLDASLREVPIGVGEGFAGRIARERAPYRLSRVERSDVVAPLFSATVESLLGVPLLIGGRLIGVLHVGSTTPREFDDDDEVLLQLVGDRVAVAIDQARIYAQEQETAAVLQRSLLPQRLPEVPGLGLAARYQPGGPNIDVGGDWYDVTPLAGGRVALSIGDVVGRGLKAAVVMGHLRAALRAYGIEGHEPHIALQRLNELVVHGGRSLATAVHMTWEPDDRLRLARAGHPPPLIVEPDGSARVLDEGGGPALGVLPFAAYGEAELDLQPGSRVVLYTDGLIERRGESLDDSIERLLDAARNAPAGADALADRLVERMLGDGSDDDAALLVFEIDPASARLDLELPVEPEALGIVRAHLRRWLREQGALHTALDDVVIAAGEACSNVVEHAYGPGSARFRIEASHEDGDAVITVRDFGRWRQQRDSGRGRGIGLMRALMDDVSVETNGSGTVVRLRRRLAAREPV